VVDLYVRKAADRGASVHEKIAEAAAERMVSAGRSPCNCLFVDCLIKRSDSLNKQQSIA